MQVLKYSATYLGFFWGMAISYGDESTKQKPGLNNTDSHRLAKSWPQLPHLPAARSDYQEVFNNNLFAPQRWLDETELSVYKLSQLKMVGYLYYRNRAYSFILTPHATIKVKVGDKIANGVVQKITNNATEIDEIQIIQHKQYINKIYLELPTPPEFKPRAKIAQ
jgi:hypothetical protein